jgi:hypothetical protein
VLEVLLDGRRRARGREGDRELGAHAALRSAIVNERARSQLSEFLESRWLRAAQRGPADFAPLRGGLASSIIVGVIFSRQIIKVPALAAADQESLVAQLAPLVQQLLAGEPGA